MAKERTVFSSPDVAHRWANRIGTEGRTSNGNFSYNGDKLISFWTTIAVKLAGATLVSINTYGSTYTGKHKRYMSKSIWGDRLDGYNERSEELTIIGSANHFREFMQDAYDRAYNSRNIGWLLEMEAWYSRLAALYRFRGISQSDAEYLRSLTLDYRGNQGKIKILEVNEAELSSDKPMLTGSFETTFSLLTTFAESKKKLIEVRTAKNEVARDLSDVKNFQRDCNDTISWLYGGKQQGSFIRRDGNCYLRVTEKAGEMKSVEPHIETSLGIKIPANKCKGLYLRYLPDHITNEAVNLHATENVDGYNVRKIDAKEIVIGCHTIAWSEANKVAKELQWIDDKQYARLVALDGEPVKDLHDLLETDPTEALTQRLVALNAEIKELQKEDKFGSFKKYWDKLQTV